MSIQQIILLSSSSLLGNRSFQSNFHVHHPFRFNPGSKHAIVQYSTTTYLGINCNLFNLRKKKFAQVPNNKQKPLMPGKLSPLLLVPNHIPRPPYTTTNQVPGIASGSEVHDQQGIECMRESGHLAAQVLQYGGTLVKEVMSRKINQCQGYKMKSRSAGNRFLVRAVSKDINFDQYSTSALQSDVIEDDDGDTDDEFSPRGRFRRNIDEEEKEFDRDPEFADILGSCLDDPERARSKMEERLRSKRNKILHTKTGSGIPMNVIFNKFGFSNSYIWFEFYNVPLEKDISLICNTIRSWHILGRLGGCNSLNMQLSQSIMDKRPSYDAIQGANVTPTTFYNIGDFEIQDKLGRIWVDIGTAEPLLLDVLINAFIQISSDYIGIKQLVFGGTEFENWKENMTSEAAGYSVHKI